MLKYNSIILLSSLVLIQCIIIQMVVLSDIILNSTENKKNNENIFLRRPEHNGGDDSQVYSQTYTDAYPFRPAAEFVIRL